jgi:DNA-binding protein YbaB
VGDEVELTGAAAMAEGFERLARQMRQTADAMSANLAEVASASHQVSSAGGEVTVDTDGRPRITGLRIAPQVMRLDSAALGELIARTLNTALHTARQAGQDALMEGLDPTMRAAFAAGLTPTRNASADRGSEDLKGGWGAP